MPTIGDGRGGSGPADSVGVTWSGRELSEHPFAADDGSADPVLTAALDGAVDGEVPLADVVRALAAGRVLVPVVAMTGEDRSAPDHVRGDPGAELALVTITLSDGRRAMPVFSSTAALVRWDAKARPIPVETSRAAVAAVAEGCESLMLDPAGPVRFDVPRVALWAMAEGREWVPPDEDQELMATLKDALGPLPDVLGLRLEPLAGSGVRIVLGIRAGLDRPALDAVVQAAQALIAEVDVLTERVDAVELRILPA